MIDLRSIAAVAILAVCLTTGCEPFCGGSTLAPCDGDGDCRAGGCSGQLCGGADEELVTTCEYRECYAASRYGLECGCVEGACDWR